MEGLSKTMQNLKQIGTHNLAVVWPGGHSLASHRGETGSIPGQRL